MSWRSGYVQVERLALARPEDAAGLARRVRSLPATPAAVRETVAAVVARVRHGGDAALRDCVRELDAAGATPGPLAVPRDELEQALLNLDADLRSGLGLAIANVTAVARAGLGEDAELCLEQGQAIRLRQIPVGRAAIYVPGGRAPYPSTVVMGAVTARVAGVEQVVVCSPPTGDGDIDATVLGACALCEVDEVLRMGGAHAIAALAYGTESITRADVIAGPGSLYVQEAKRIVSGDVGIDGFHGPSDLLVLLDEADDQVLDLMCLDLLAQAEHGPESLVVALSCSPRTVEALAARLLRAEAQGMCAAGACALITCSDWEPALTFAEALAPEHLQLVGPGAEYLAPRVRRAGCLFVGAASGTAFGDYLAGSNHILPTAGAARFQSALAPRHFRRTMAEVQLGSSPLALAAPGAAIARAEGFELHARSMEARADLGRTSESGVGENRAHE